jgi:hypothetical protein
MAKKAAKKGKKAKVKRVSQGIRLNRTDDS